VLQGEPATAVSDCYSYGLVLWELLAWRASWSGLSPFVIRRTVLEGGRPQLPPLGPLPGPDAPPPEELDAYCQLVR
jgi:hypothetical protein